MVFEQKQPYAIADFYYYSAGCKKIRKSAA